MHPSAMDSSFSRDCHFCCSRNRHQMVGEQDTKNKMESSTKTHQIRHLVDPTTGLEQPREGDKQRHHVRMTAEVFTKSLATLCFI